MQAGSGSTVKPKVDEEDALFTDRLKDHKKNLPSRRGKCFYCQRKGHFAKDCNKKKADQKRHESANRIEAEQNPKVNNSEVALAANEGHQSKDELWWIDSGASQHMTPDRENMTNFVKFGKPVEVKLADNSTVFAYGKGDLHFPVFDGSKRIDLSLKDALYVPKIGKKLLSLSTMTERGAEVRFVGRFCKIIINEKMLCIGQKDGKLYRLNTRERHSSFYGYADNVNISSELWHCRYGHLGYDNLKLLSDKAMLDGLNLDSNEKFDRNCEGCAQGKQHRKSFPKKSERKSKDLLEIIHSDVSPVNVNSVGGSRSYVTFIDDYSRFTSIYFMKNKSEVLEKFKEFVALAENHTGKKVKVLRSDNGGEYTSLEFVQYCAERGIKRELTIPMTPQQNGVSERMNRTVMESARSMLHHAKLPLNFWAEAVNTAVYLRNKSPTTALAGVTPYERWYGHKPEVSNLKVFGCNAFVHVPDQKRRKLEKKSVRCTFVGYPNNSKGYKFYDPEKRKMFRSRDAKFLENDFKHGHFEDVKEHDYEQMFNIDEIESVPECNPDEAENSDLSSAEDHVEEVQEELMPRRSQRIKTVPDRLGIITGDWWTNEELNVASVAVSGSDEPRCIYDALNGKHAQEWQEALNSEYSSLIKNKAWNLVKLPKGRKTVDCRWVFKIKQNADGSVERYKARLVAKGYSQKEGVDYEETFSPVARYTSIRTVLAIANQLNLELHQMDVQTAFLNGELQEEIYMTQPDGFIQEGKEDLVCKLNKSLYGLKQASRCWFQTMDTFLKESGYEQCKSDSCLYIKRVGAELMIIALYVDDLLLATNSKKMLRKEKAALQKRFCMKDLGEAHYCLGIEIQRDRAKKQMLLHQTRYLTNLLAKFGMENCKPTSTPQEAGSRLLPHEGNPVEKQRYQALIGSLTYAVTSTRPDIAQALGSVNQFCSNPGNEHWKSAKRILRYIKGTVDWGICFQGAKETTVKLSGFVDADWGGNPNGRKSQSGYVFELCGGIVSWASKRQATVALSSTEAEYVAASLATKEAIWLRTLLSDLNFIQRQPTVLHEDNQGAIAMSKNPKYHARTKHIDIKHHFIRDKVLTSEILLKYCPTEDMVADVLTKPLSKVNFERFKTLLHLRSVKNFS